MPMRAGLCPEHLELDRVDQSITGSWCPGVQAYDPNNPEDDMKEREEEMERMREHVFKSVEYLLFWI